MICDVWSCTAVVQNQGLAFLDLGSLEFPLFDELGDAEDVLTSWRLAVSLFLSLASALWHAWHTVVSWLLSLRDLGGKPFSRTRCGS